MHSDNKRVCCSGSGSVCDEHTPCRGCGPSPSSMDPISLRSGGDWGGSLRCLWLFYARTLASSKTREWSTCFRDREWLWFRDREWSTCFRDREWSTCFRNRARSRCFRDVQPPDTVSFTVWQEEPVLLWRALLLRPSCESMSRHCQLRDLKLPACLDRRGQLMPWQ